MSRKAFLQIYQSLLEHHGPQQWWPADSEFEVMIGAILVQNTAWKNVINAIDNLKQADLLSVERLLSVPENKIADLIRPVGYFNVKTKRLLHYCQWYQQVGGYPALDQLPTNELRQQLLDVHGIGPETADDILLYAFNRPVFVIDAYTRRLFSRLDLLDENLHYETMRSEFENILDQDVELFNEYHALIDVHAARVCKKKPLCENCCLLKHCAFA